MNNTLPKLLTLLLLSSLTLWGRIDYAHTSQGQAFAKRMHQRHKMDTQRVLGLLHQAKHQSETLGRYQGKRKVGSTDYSWHRYKSKILIPKSVDLGKKFMHKYRKWLDLASKKYHVSPAIITAFIRVETKFGMYGSEYPVWDSLVTLGLNPNRKHKFFRGELEKVLVLARKNHLDVRKLRGSFAGAMGCVQQVPSIQLRYAVDLNGDGRKDPNDMRDCIGSIAYFLHRNGWSDARPTVVRAKHSGNGFRSVRSGYRSIYPLSTLRRHGITPAQSLGSKKAYYIRMKDGNKWNLYLGDRNYRIITLYNASKRYAITIALYAKAMGYRN
jgi:membrane-bound lytic murein transglycosylase B